MYSKGLLFPAGNSLSLKLDKLTYRKRKEKLAKDFITRLESFTVDVTSSEKELRFQDQVIVPADLELTDLMSIRNQMRSVEKHSSLKVKYMFAPMDHEDAELTLHVLTNGRKRAEEKERVRLTEYVVDKSCLVVGQERYYFFYERHFKKYHIIFVKET